jgi:preprotein translocase subunit SecG
MYIALISVIIFICVLLVLVVLAQNSKGGGLSSQFGGAGTSQLMGVKRTGDLLEKLTWGFAVALIVLSLTSHMMMDDTEGPAELRSVNREKAQESSVTAPAPAAIPSQSESVSPGTEGSVDPAEIPTMTDTAN